MWTATYAPAKSRPRPSNACGIATPANRLPSAATTSSHRTNGLSGSYQSANQVVVTQIHQTPANNTAVRSAPARVRSCSRCPAS